MLVAPAALSLMAPLAAKADNNFAITTTLSGAAVFTTGTVDGSESTVTAAKKVVLYNNILTLLI